MLLVRAVHRAVLQSIRKEARQRRKTHLQCRQAGPFLSADFTVSTGNVDVAWKRPQAIIQAGNGSYSLKASWVQRGPLAGLPKPWTGKG